MRRVLGSALLTTLLTTLLTACPSDATPDPPPPTSGPVTPEQLASGGACPTPTGAGTPHQGTIAADETWTAAGSPHRVEARVQIRGATVTVEACAVVLIAPDVMIEVDDGGRLIARGTAAIEGDARVVRPVRFDRAGSEPWGSIVAFEDGAIELAVTAVQNGGSSSGDGALVARGSAGGTNGGPLTRNLTVDRVLIDGSAGTGLNLLGWAAFTDGSRTLWVRGSAAEGVRLEPGMAATLPPELVLEGNGTDAILLLTSKAFIRDDTLVARGVPYLMRGPLYLNSGVDGTPATLTIEAGVTIGFEDSTGSGIYVGSSAARLGDLVAVGREDAPIVFQSGQRAPAPGDWQGLVFSYYTPTSHISHAQILHAGADSRARSAGCGPNDNDAAVIIYGMGPDNVGPSRAFIDQTTFDQLAGETVIVSGWYATSGPDFSADNAFGSATPACKVSQPARTGGGDTCDGGRDVCWP